MNKLWILMLLILGVVETNAQSFYMASQFEYDGLSRNTNLIFNSVGNNQIVAAIAPGYDTKGLSFKKLVMIDQTTGLVLSTQSISNNLPPNTNQVVGIRLFDSIGYMLYYDTVLPGYPFSYQESISCAYRFYEYRTNNLLWESMGSLRIIPDSYWRLPNIDRNGDTWFQNPIEKTVLKLDLTTGDTLMQKSYKQLMQLWQFDSTLQLNDLTCAHSTLVKRDTLVIRAVTSQVDSFGNLTNPKIYTFLATSSSLARISDTTQTLALPTTPSQSLKNHIDSVWYDYFNNSYTRVIFEYDRITKGKKQILVLDTLSFQPDTIRFRKVHNYKLLEHGKFKAYFENYYVPSPNDPRIDIEELKIRLYENGSLTYQRVFNRSMFSGFGEFITFSHILNADGSIWMNGKDDLISFDTFLMKIDPQGNHFLSTPVLEPIEDKTEVQIYPTHVVNQLYAKATEEMVEIQVLSFSGQVVLSQNLNSKTATVQLHHLPAGVYLVLVKQKTGARSFKIVKE